MLFLVFYLGDDCYALAASQVAEVLPLVHLKQIPHAPSAIAGAMDYRGTVIPVVDLSALALGRAATRRLSTRIVLVHYLGRDGPSELLGLIAERATQTLRIEAEAFQPAGVDNPEARYLGPVARGPRGLVQRVEIDALLGPALRALLFSAGGET